MRVAVFNAKGGTGRTTTALNLLAAIARSGHRPCGIDLDPQCQLSAFFGVAPQRANESVYSCLVDGAPLAEVAQITRSGVVLCPGHHALGKLDAVLGRGPGALKRLADGLAHPFAPEGAVVMDCPRRLTVACLNALFACDLLIVPITADYLALRAAVEVERALKALEPVLKRRLPRRYLLTRFARGAPMAEQVAEALATTLPIEDTCTTRIAESLEVAQSPTAGLDVFRHAPDSAGARDYEALLDELGAAGFRP